MFPSEHLIQQECIGWFRNEFERKGNGVIIPVPNELARKRKDVTICNGASDLIVVLNGLVLFCELKTAYNTQSPDQIKFESNIKSLGLNYTVCRSLVEFQKHVLSWVK